MKTIVSALRRDVVGGLLLILAGALALVWANSPWSASYESIRTLTFGPQTLHLNLSLQTWAADGLLALFFFIVGAELKHEFVSGQLRDPRRAMVPIVAAASGAIVPALIFAAINFTNPETLGGWGIPMATDVAFAIALLAILGKHLPPALRTFLLTLAVVDDLIAILVIALFYTAGVAILWLVGALGMLGAFWFLQRSRLLDNAPVLRWVVYVPLAVVIWFAMHESGVHATIAGVAMGMLMRTTKRATETVDPCHRLENMLRPWVMGLALPVFAFLSAGVAFNGLWTAFGNTIAVGIIVGLVAGKLIGITGGAWLTTKLARARLDPTLAWSDIVGMSQLAGIGFTVSLLISELSYGDTALEYAKSGVLLGSLIAALLAAFVLTARNRHYRRLAGNGARTKENPR